MRTICVLLLAFIAVINAHSTGVQISLGSPAAPGENPYVVHLTIAVFNSGLLNFCMGSLYTKSLVLTAASCVKDARFIWIRYGAVDVIRPELVTESSSATVHPEYNQQTGDNDVAVIRINRIVQSTDKISPISVADIDATLPSSGKFCAYGSDNGMNKCNSLNSSARFIWIRYGAVDVIRPELVTESSSATVHPEYNQQTGDNDVAVIRINRIVQSTDNISPISVADIDATLPSSGKFCAYGSDNGKPGEQLKCKELNLETSDGVSVIAKEGNSSQFDLGAPLVSDGVQYGILVRAGESSVFLNVAQYRDWLAVQPSGVGSPVAVLDL